MSWRSGTEKMPLLTPDREDIDLSKRHRHRGLGVLLIFVCLAVSLRFSAPSGAKEYTSPFEDEVKDKFPLFTSASRDSWTRVIITQDQMIEMTDMKDYFRSLGLDATSFVNKGYLPEKIEVKYDRDMIEGEVGSDAFEFGQVAFTLTHKNVNGTANRVYNTVVYLNGTLRSFSPMSYYYDDIYPGSFKFYEADPTYVIMGTKSGGKWHGPAMLWNWDGSQHSPYKNLTTLDVIIDAHDVSSCHTNLLPSKCTIWGIDSGVAAYDRLGNTADCGNYTTSHTSGDLNHGQVLGLNATMAVISDRGDSSIIVMQLPGSAGEPIEVRAIIGGPNGNISLVDEHGNWYKAGASLWVGQHNAEYVGDDEFYLYDNHATGHNDSRALIVKLNSENNSATIEWSYDMGFYNPVYGDVDRVANDHIQVCAWVYSTSATYDMIIQEVVRETQVAPWELKVVNSDSTEKATNAAAGWNIYSAERHYERPLMWNITCVVKGDDSEIFFWALNRFKMGHSQTGNLIVYDADGEEVHHAKFDFLPFFKPSPVNITYSSHKICMGGSVEIRNQWGDTTSKLV